MAASTLSLIFDLVMYVDIVLYLGVGHFKDLERTTDTLISFIKMIPAKFRSKRVSLYFRIQSENG